MNKVHVYFKNGDEIVRECLDMKIENGFLIIIYRQFSDNEEDPIAEGFSVETVDCWEFIRMQGENEDA